MKKIQAKFVPTEIGTVVTKLLVKNFPYIFDTAYTATLEGELDAVEDGTEKWTDLLNGFYDHFEKELQVAEQARWKTSSGWSRRPTEVCDNCGSSADSEVGQVRELLLVLELLEGEADDGGGGAVEEGSEDGAEEDHEGVDLPDHREGDDRGCGRVFEGGRTTEGVGGGDRRGDGAGQEGHGGAVQLRLHEGELCGEAGPECSGSG